MSYQVYPRVGDTASVQVLSTSDRNLWQSFLPARHSAYGSVEFASIIEQQKGCKARLFVLTRGEEVVAYPLFLRPISELPFVANTQIEAWDAVTPEYTGPLAPRAVDQATANSFLRLFAEYCQQERIITEFAHLHPWNWSADLLAAAGVSLDREIIYVDLTRSEDQIWRDSFTYSCRKFIKQARRENVRVFEAETEGDIQEFYRIYIGTMRRNQALDKYFFPLDYFIAVFQGMSDHARFVLAEYNDQIVAANLSLHDDVDVYAYLGGADHAFQHVRPTNAVIHETILWARRQGKKRLILGGGYRPNDGVFRFKAGFSPLRAKFYVYKHIHLPDEYAALCHAWSAYYHRDTNLSGYFPAYRAIPISVEQES